MNKHAAMAWFRRWHVRQGALTVLLLLVGMGLVGFSVGYVVDAQMTARIQQLEHRVAELQAVVDANAQRNYAIQKVISIIDRYNPEMPSQDKYRIADEIYNLSLRYDNLSIDLLCAVITHETGGTWNPRVVSPAGAMGLMQVMPSTGRYVAQMEGIHWTSAEDVLFDPIKNLRIGARYLSDLVSEYGLEGALAAYNGGSRRASRWLASGKQDHILYGETRRYVPAIVKLYEEYRALM